MSLVQIHKGYIDANGPSGLKFENMAEILDHVKAGGAKQPDKFKSWESDVFLVRLRRRCG